MARYTRTDYVCQFPGPIQKGIRTAVQNALRKQGYLSAATRKEAVEDAMDSRLNDLKDIINVQYWLDKANGKK